MENAREPTPEDPQLRALMADYQNGSIAAFDLLHAALAPDLKVYLTALARDPSWADDLLQETFLQIHRARAAYIPGQPLRPWVFAVAKRVFLMSRRSALRRERRERRVNDQPAPATGIAADRLQARQEVELALRHVPPDGRRAFVLHHLMGLSFREIGARLGINTGSAKRRSSRAAEIMRAILRGKNDD